MVVLLALSLAQEKRGKESPPFFARIITPDELQKKMPRPPKLPDLPKKEKAFRMPKLPKDIPPPKDLSAVPSQKTPEQWPKKVSPESGAVSKGSEESLARKYTEPLRDSGIGAKGEGAADSNKRGISEKPAFKTFREKFFDKDVIGKLAKKDKETTKPDNGITFDTKEFKYYGYLQRLKEKIEGIWKYPADAVEKGIYGDLYIKFTIKKNGRLGTVELIRTSGHKSLDDAAIKALREAEPYWPLPDEWGQDGLTITGHFVYSLSGFYIR